MEDTHVLGSPKGRKATPKLKGENTDHTFNTITVTETIGGIVSKHSVLPNGSVISTSDALISPKFSLKKILYDIFLPVGYPHSVTPDYLSYQIFDSIQAMASSFTGTLSTKAILQGVGVGNEAATAAGATIQWIIKDGSGMIGRIAFSWFHGTNLDSNAKTWRFMADILNDLAMTLEMSIHSYPEYFLPLVCTGSVLKAIVGCAGGATRAALTQHQARNDNMADVSAKDGNQETAVGLIGMLLAFLMNFVIGDSLQLTWIFFVVFTFIHLLSNYFAVRSVTIDKLNYHRADLLVKEFIFGRRVIPPDQLARYKEHVLYFNPSPSIELGCNVDKLIALSKGNSYLLHQRLETLRQEHFLVIHDGSGKVFTFYTNLADHNDILHSFYQSEVILLGKSKEFLHDYRQFAHGMRLRGWNNSSSLLAASAVRITFE